MNVFEKDILIRSGTCDRFGRWKPNEILMAMQEMAGEHSEYLGCGRENLIKRSGAIWILTRSEFYVRRYPVWLDVVKARTFPTAARRTLYPRFFVFENQQGEVLATASSYWAVMDLAAGAMASLDWVNACIPKNDDLEKPMGYPSAVKQAEAAEQIIPYTPRFADLDLNGHVNNTRCADWVTDLMGEEVLGATPIQSLVVNYNREIRGKEPVDFSFRLSDTAYSLRCSRDGVPYVDVGGALMPPGDEGGKPSPLAAL